MAFGGLALKGVSWFLRGIEFCCAAIILGIFSYFLAVLANHNLPIDTYLKAVEGISGAGVLYTIFALVLVCCLGGIAFFSAIGMLLDFCFTGAFAYIAYATRQGRKSCTGLVRTPLGSGNTGTGNTVPNGKGGSIALPSFHTACRLNTVCFAVAIIGAAFFFLSIFVELALIRHHKKEKAFGPSPNNGYTAGSPKRKFWQRKRKNRDAEFGAGGGLAAEKHPDALPVHHTDPNAVRSSYATDTTAVGGQEPVYNKYGNTPAVGGQEPAYNKYGSTPAAPVHQSGYTTTTTTNTGGYTPYSTGAGHHSNTTGTF